eukprot:GFUD01023350.1.p1 GENE.GFUD01023350.1~~GFUD01023350.1.p1  ORF type:complete len:330 (+),score=110.60 GFUD01023350.1:49-1038(+)
MATKDTTKPLFGVPHLHHTDTAGDDLQSKPTTSLDHLATSSKPPHPTSGQTGSNEGFSMKVTTDEVQSTQRTADMQILKSKRRRGPKKVKKLKDPLAPRRPSSSFLMFCSLERPKVVTELGSKAPGPVAGELGKRWSELDKETKEMWEQRGSEAWASFEEKKKNYRPSEDFLSAAADYQNNLIKQSKADPGKVVDKMAPYFNHLQTNWLKIATSRPELSTQEVQEMVWQNWSSSTQGNKGLGGKERGKKMVKGPMAPKRPMVAYMIYLTKMRILVTKEKPEMSVEEVMTEVGRMWKTLDEEEKAPYMKEAAEKSKEYNKEMEKFKGLKC